MMMYSFPSGPKVNTPPLWLPRSTGSVGSATLFRSFWNARSRMMLLLKVRVLPFHTKRSTRLPSNGTFASTFESAAGRALGVVEVHERHPRELRVQRDAEQAPLAGGVHGEVEHDAGDDAVGDALDLSRRLLGDQDVVWPDERHRDRLIEAAHDRRHAKGGVHRESVPGPQATGRAWRFPPGCRTTRPRPCQTRMRISLSASGKCSCDHADRSPPARYIGSRVDDAYA